MASKTNKKAETEAENGACGGDCRLLCAAAETAVLPYIASSLLY